MDTVSADTSPSPTVFQVGLDAESLDVRLRDARRRRDVAGHELAFYLCEMEVTGRYQALGFRSLGQYGEERLGMSRRRVCEFARADRELRRLTRVARACEEGRIGWTKAELLTHGIQSADQDEWIARAEESSCAELREMLRRDEAGMALEPGGQGGLPMPCFNLMTRLSAGQERKLEEVRRCLMKRLGRRVADEEIVGLLLEGFEVPVEVEAEEAEPERVRSTALQEGATPPWMRERVKLRDGFRCQAACHGLVHAGVLGDRGVIREGSNLQPGWQARASPDP